MSNNAVCPHCFRTFSTDTGLCMHLSKSPECKAYNAKLAQERSRLLQTTQPSPSPEPHRNTSGSSVSRLRDENSLAVSEEPPSADGTARESGVSGSMDVDSVDRANPSGAYSIVHDVHGMSTADVEAAADENNDSDEERVFTTDGRPVIDDDEEDEEGPPAGSLPSVSDTEALRAARERLRSVLLEVPPVHIKQETPKDAAWVFEKLSGDGIDTRTPWEKRRDAEDPSRPFKPWKSEAEFRLVDFLTKSALSQAQIDEFLGLQFVRTWLV